MYSIKTTNIKNSPKYWDYLNVEIYQDNIKVGEYQRNYHAMYDTFCPFEQDGKWYALYSRDYTSTRIMSLPDCKDLGGEERDSFGFCPTGYYVPDDANGKFGFISGCVWGDDNSWKLQYLDLENCKDGIIKREARFGYLELPSGVSLKDAVDYTYYDEDDEYLRIACAKTFDRKTGNIYE